MPIAANPDARFEIVLESDKELYAESPALAPAFIYRYLTKLSCAPVTELCAPPAAARSDPQLGEDIMERAFEVIKTGLVDWRNMPDLGDIPGSMVFDASRLDEILTPAEAFEILFKLVRQGYGPTDKKKSGSPSPTPTASSVDPAPAEPTTSESTTPD